MPQDANSGRAGLENGYKRADSIAGLIGARRLGSGSNEFAWGSRTVVIKTGTSPVVTRAMLARVDAVVYGALRQGRWTLYEVLPSVFEELSAPSQSRAHDENYRQVRVSEIRARGEPIPVP